jgi:hypothetical protein
MAQPDQVWDYYFDDKKAPDGWHEYHLQRRGQVLELFRDGKTIKEAVGPELSKDTKLFEQRVLRVLEYCVLHARQPFDRAALAQEFHSAVEQYLTRLRILLNDRKPWRFIQRSGSGEIVFAMDVRNTPSPYHATYRSELQKHWKPRAMGSGGLFQGGQWYFVGRTAVLRHIVEWLAQTSSGGTARVVTGDPGSGKSAILGFLVTCSDQEEIQQPNLSNFLETMPEGTIPTPAGVDFAINLWNRTLDTTFSALADHFRCDPENVVHVLVLLGHKRTFWCRIVLWDHASPRQAHKRDASRHI